METKDTKDLFESFFTGMQLKNRIVMAPMTRARAIGSIPNDLMALYYSQRATAGLIITEGTAPSPNGLGYARIPGIYSKEQVEGWKKVTTAIHENGGKIFVQIMHVGRVAHSANLPENKNITKWEYLVQAALETGLEIVQFKQDYDGSAKELFKADLEFAKHKGVRGFPALFFVNTEGKQEIIYGYKPYERFEQAILNLYPGAEKRLPGDSAKDIFSHYPTLTTKEFAVITNKTKEESEEILESMANQNIVQKISTRNGAFWRIKDASKQIV